MKHSVTIAPGSSLDSFLRAHRRDTRFLLGSGFYYCSSAFAFCDLDYCLLGPGCELIGEGSRETTLQIREPAIPAGAGQIECLTAGSRSGGSGMVTIRGLQVDASLVAQHDQLGIVGVHVWSDRCVIDDLSVIGITGVRSKPGEPSREGFGLLVNQSGGPGIVGRSRISNVHVQLAASAWEAEHYVCGCYVGFAAPRLPSFVERILVQNPGPVPAHAAFGVNGGVIGTGWINLGRWNRGIFCDVTGGENTFVWNSCLVAERVGVEFRGGAGVAWKSIHVRDSRIILQPPGDADYAAVLVLVDDSKDRTGAEFSDVKLLDCSLDYLGDPTKQPLFVGSCDASRTKRCGVMGGQVYERAGSPVLTKVTPAAGFVWC